MSYMKKKGELTSFFVITSLLALIGFLILIWFVVRVGIPDDAETQACHLSVITRATAYESASQFVPLHCTTQKICLKDGKGTCDISFAGDRVREIKVDKRDDNIGNLEATRTVEATLTEEMYSCWKMMGEGKLDLFQSLKQKAGLESVKSTCVICSRVALDVANERRQSILDQVDLPAYLKSHKVPSGDVTYLQAFTDQSVQSYSRISEDVLARDFDEREFLELQPKNSEYAIVFMQIKPVSFSDALKNVGSAATVAGGAFVLTPIPFKKILTRAAGRGLLTLPGLIVAGVGAGAGTAYVWSNTDQSKQAAAGYCGEVSVPGGGSVKSNSAGADASKGCSVVQVVPYDASAINKICNYIESTP